MSDLPGDQRKSGETPSVSHGSSQTPKPTSAQSFLPIFQAFMLPGSWFGEASWKIPLRNLFQGQQPGSLSRLFHSDGHIGHAESLTALS